MSSVLDLGPEALRARLRGWLLARVLVVTIFLGAVAASHLTPEADTGYPLHSIIGLIVVAYLFSIGSAYAVGTARDLRVLAFAQVGADVLFITAAVLMTGALGSPMAVWYNLAIIGAAILLSRRGAFGTATLSTLLYGGLIDLIYYNALPAAFGFEPPGTEAGFQIVYRLTVNIASFYSIAFLSSILVERIDATELALKQSEANFQRIEHIQNVLVQNLESAVLTTDANGVVQSANDAVTTIVGKPAADVVGRNISDIFPLLRPPVGAKRVLDPSPIPIELSHRAGGEAPEQILRFSTAPLTDTYRNLIGTLYIVQDITAVKKLAAEEEAATAALAEDPFKGEMPQIHGFLGRSSRIRPIAELIHKVAPTDSTVLITGESGTGKELAARAIHSLSNRRAKPMVVVNCGAIPANLIESELFGHVRGAFTGAVADRRGLFRSADGGTIFLDEVGDMPLALHVKLLRVLQERSFTPVGSQSQVVVDVRIIAATNRDLERHVETGNFREDLFYRLNVIRLQMPPLRERPEDLPILIEHFLGRFAESFGRPPCKISQGAMRKLLAYGYPGNIRELENIIEHCVALADGDVVKEDSLPFDLRPSPAAAPPSLPSTVNGSEAPRNDWMKEGSSNLDAELEAIERQLLEEALRRSGGVRKRAAEILGINYRSLRHRLSKYGFGEVES